MSPPRIRDYGDRALLIECDDVEGVLALAGMLRETRLPGVSDIVPGARTVLLHLEAVTHRARARVELEGMDLAGAAGHDAEPLEVVIEVVYDGEDLAEVSRRLNMDARDVVAAHTGTPWRVGFGGFAPGFAYLVGGDPRLAVPRRAEPRTRVPAGAVALAGEFSGIYPRESPGGWQIIGRTDAALWDADRAQPALLAPGMRVRFRSVGTP
ncbi:MAG: allophanate hydrolase subunit 1 [Mycobacterium sp.]|nr:allophanate hydrolase subunit 1 [Mycobacterium sp.]